MERKGVNYFFLQVYDTMSEKHKAINEKASINSKDCKLIGHYYILVGTQVFVCLFVSFCCFC